MSDLDRGCAPNPAPMRNGPDGPASSPSPCSCGQSPTSDCAGASGEQEKGSHRDAPANAVAGNGAEQSSKWCDDCAWPEECAAEVCCRRREAGEIRSAAPSETAAKIERSLPGAIVLNGVMTKEQALRLARLRMLTPVKRGDVFGWQP